MISVAIMINGEPLVIKMAVNQSERNDRGETKYLNDAGEIIWHKREDGAVKLAVKMLETIEDAQANQKPVIDKV